MTVSLENTPPIQPEEKDLNNNFSTRLLVNSSETEFPQVLNLEQKVWNENKYGNLDVYKKYIGQSRTFAAFNDSGECIGVTRLFAGGPEIPPFVSEMPIENPSLKMELLHGCDKHVVEELGIAAVDKDAPAIRVTTELWRRAWRDADERGIKIWGIIMEPERVQIMRKRYGFPFEQIGAAVDYQGGECAAHIMRFEEVHTYMKTNRPEYYSWFVEESL